MPARPRRCPVDDAAVDSTLPHRPAVVADMVRFQRLAGSRPAEVCTIRPCDVDTSGDMWHTPSQGSSRAARAARLGLWAGKEPVSPWEFRRTEAERKATAIVRPLLEARIETGVRIAPVRRGPLYEKESCRCPIQQPEVFQSPRRGESSRRKPRRRKTPGDIVSPSLVKGLGSGCYSAWYFSSVTTSSGRRSSYSTFSPSRTCRIPSRTILSSTPTPCLMTKMSSNSFWMTISR